MMEVPDQAAERDLVLKVENGLVGSFRNGLVN